MTTDERRGTPAAGGADPRTAGRAFGQGSRRQAVRTRARAEAPRASRYAVVGVANVLMDFLLYAALVTVGVWYPLAKAISLTIATAQGYFFNRTWTFKAGPHRHELLVRYAIVQIGCYLGNVLLLAGLVEFSGLHEISAQAIAIPVIAAASFIAQRLWTFKAPTD